MPRGSNLPRIGLWMVACLVTATVKQSRVEALPLYPLCPSRLLRFTCGEWGSATSSDLPRRVIGGVERRNSNHG